MYIYIYNIIIIHRNYTQKLFYNYVFFSVYRLFLSVIHAARSVLIKLKYLSFLKAKTFLGYHRSRIIRSTYRVEIWLPYYVMNSKRDK